jgi:hypothetical protein
MTHITMVMETGGLPCWQQHTRLGFVRVDLPLGRNGFIEGRIGCLLPDVIEIRSPAEPRGCRGS